MTSTARGRRFLAFNSVGAAGVVVQIAGIALLVEWAGVDYQAATVAGVAAALVHNFAWHRVWTWADRRATGTSLLPAFGRFLMANGLVSLVGNVIAIRWLVGAAGLPLLPASGLSIAACGVVNYWLADRHVFAARTPSLTPPGRPRC